MSFITIILAFWQSFIDELWASFKFYHHLRRIIRECSQVKENQYYIGASMAQNTKMCKSEEETAALSTLCS